MQERRILEPLLGMYVATILLPVLTLFGPVPVESAVGPLIGIGVAMAGVVTLSARTVPNLANRTASLPIVLCSTLPPLAYLPYLIVATTPGSREGALAAVGLLAILPGLLVPVGGAIIRSRALRGTASERLVVTVGEEDGESSELAVAGIVLVGFATVVAGVTIIFTGETATGAALTSMSGVWTSLLPLLGNDTTEVAVTDLGIRIDRSFTVWDDLRGYRLSEESVELVRARRYHPNRSFERDEISEEDAFVEALGEFLPRLDERGRIDKPPRNPPGDLASW
jgi:hypothetical protein